MEKLRYSEILYSVQGEGRFVGVPSVFFRTYVCNFHFKKGPSLLEGPYKIY